jgi:hypothetical protein
MSDLQRHFQPPMITFSFDTNFSGVPFVVKERTHSSRHRPLKAFDHKRNINTIELLIVQ